MLHAEPVHLARELFAELVEQVLAQELLLQRLEDTRFDFIAPDGQVVVAASLIPRAKASEAMLARHDESGTADAAFGQAREQILRSSRADWIPRGSDRVSTHFLTPLCIRPELVGHNA